MKVRFLLVAVVLCLCLNACSEPIAANSSDKDIPDSDSNLSSETSLQLSLPFLAFDPHVFDGVIHGTEPEIVLCAESPTFFILKPDSEGGYAIFLEEQYVGSILLFEDSDRTYFEKCQTIGDNILVSEITDLSVQMGRECVRNTVSYPVDKNTGESNDVHTDYNIVKIGSYSLRLQALQDSVEETFFQECFSPFIKTISIKE